MTCYKVLVGTLTLTAPVTVSESFECAAWSRSLSVAPGTYPVYAYIYPRFENEPARVHQMAAECEGEVVSASFRSRIGAHYGSDRGAEEIGTRQMTHLELPTYGSELAAPRDGRQLDLDATILSLRSERTAYGPSLRYQIAQGIVFRAANPAAGRYGASTIDAVAVQA